KGLEGRPVEPSGDRRMAEERLGLRREEEQPTAVPVVERLFPEPVARHEQTPLRVVPDGEGEHPGEALDARLAVDRVRVQDHLGVAPRSEPTPPGLQLGAQLAEVVDLAVDDDPVPSGGAAQRLPAAYAIEERRRRARASARRLRSSASVGSDSTRVSKEASSRSCSGSNRRPASATTSGSAARFEATTGAPHAIASSAVAPKPSARDGTTYTAAPE